MFNVITFFIWASHNGDYVWWNMIVVISEIVLTIYQQEKIKVKHDCSSLVNLF